MVTFKLGKYCLFLLVTCFLLSCQKELDKQDFTNCVIERIDVYEQAGIIPVESYSYTYDPRTRWPIIIDINFPALSFTRSISISVSADNREINLGPTGILRLDGARRVVELSIDNAFPGGDKGAFFYGYNNNGFLQDRLFDDGVSSLERIDFENNSTSLSAFAIRQGGPDPLATGTISYLPAPNLGNNALLPFAELFTELLPFYPLIRLGALSNLPIDKMEIELPGLGGAALNYQFGNYQLNNEGALTGFENTLSLPGVPSVKRRFQVTYKCD